MSNTNNIYFNEEVKPLILSTLAAAQNDIFCAIDIIDNAELATLLLEKIKAGIKLNILLKNKYEAAKSSAAMAALIAAGAEIYALGDLSVQLQYGYYLIDKSTLLIGSPDLSDKDKSNTMLYNIQLITDNNPICQAYKKEHLRIIEVYFAYLSAADELLATAEKTIAALREQIRKDKYVSPQVLASLQNNKDAIKLPDLLLAPAIITNDEKIKWWKELPQLWRTIILTKVFKVSATASRIPSIDAIDLLLEHHYTKLDLSLLTAHFYAEKHIMNKAIWQNIQEMLCTIFPKLVELNIHNNGDFIQEIDFQYVPNIKKISGWQTNIQWLHNISLAKDLNELLHFNRGIFDAIFEKKDFIYDKAGYHRNIEN